MQEILKGIAASPGIVGGRVRIILDTSQMDEMRNGEILVTKITSPLFLPAMIKAQALVTDVGGATSHGAVVARELGIPAVVGTGDATDILSNGQLIAVDGSKGVVYGYIE